MGGSGSGNYGHAGRKGIKGGSGSGKLKDGFNSGLSHGGRPITTTNIKVLKGDLQYFKNLGDDEGVEKIKARIRQLKRKKGNR